MATKKENIENPRSCLNKAADDEPIFVLRAKDPIAAEIVRYWASIARTHHEFTKVLGAMNIAGDMEQWRTEHGQ